LGFDLKPKAFVPIDVARKLWGAHEQSGFVEARDFHCLSKETKSLSYDAVKLTNRGKRFDRDSEREQIQSALSGMAKAVDERLVIEAEMLQTLLEGALDDDLVRYYPHLRRFDLHYIFPVLILDGKLKSWRNGTITDANEILHEVSLRSKHYFHDRLVGVVTKQHFNEWLAQFERDANLLVQKITKQRDKLDRQVELLEKNRIKARAEEM